MTNTITTMSKIKKHITEIHKYRNHKQNNKNTFKKEDKYNKTFDKNKINKNRLRINNAKKQKQNEKNN